MFYRKILLLFLFTILCTKAFSAVFVVTSNADAGPGTLREALTKAAANGIAEKDYINFNLPDLSEAGRTITFLSQLPTVTSNVVIDGTTQPGGSLNKGDAGVIIMINQNANTIPGGYNEVNTAGLIINGNGIEVYGISFTVIFNGTYSIFTKAGILISNSQNVTIGAPHKGNFFENNDFSIYAENDVNTDPTIPVINLKVQSNFIFYAPSAFGDMKIYGQNIFIGGDEPLAGNYITDPLDVDGSNIQIVHNYLDVDKNGNPVNGYSPVINCMRTGTNNVVIRNNISSALSLNLENISDFKIYANTDIGIRRSTLTSIVLQDCNNGIIGSDDVTLQNLFHGNNNGYMIGNNYSGNVQILKNSISCSEWPYYVDTENTNIKIPDIKVLINNDTEYSGTATPNSSIYIYEDNTDCPVCNPVIFYKKITADGNGNWKITGNFKDKKIIANALYNKNSSEFTIPVINDGHFSVTMPSCGQNNGAISVDLLKNVIDIKWYDSNDQKIGEGPKIEGLKPGDYYAVGYNGNCSARSDVIGLRNIQPQIFDNGIVKKNPSCGKGGAITGLNAILNDENSFFATYKWTDENNKQVGDELDVYDLPAGKYTLSMTDDYTKCTITYGPVTLKNTTGPNIDQTNAKIQSTNCGETTGAVTNITVTGTGSLKYSWKNSQQQEVGTSKDLTGQPGGLYTLEVTDDTQCGPVYSTQIEIPEVNGITLDESKTKPTSASCSMDNGTITGIAVTGNALYKWVDANGKIAGTSPDLTNAAPGDYVFTAYNNAGCSKTSQSYHIGLQQPTQFPVYQSTIVPACFAANNGSVNITADALVKSVRWVNGQGQSIADNVIRTGIAAGMYKLYLTDQNGCETFYKSYTVPEIPVFDVTGTGQVTNDNCGLKTGSISGPVITGGLPPYSYIWRNSEGVQIGSGNSLSGLGAGEYKLSIADTRCGNADIPYTVFDVAETVAAPSVANVQLCSAGNAVVKVNNPSANILYRLYADAGSAQPLQEQVGGTFKVTATTSTNFYVSQLTGTCESDRTAVSVSVGLSSINIANAFTPNNDGINDYWKIPGIENYPAALVQVFSRYGQKVFESKGYSHPFDGTLNGNNLPVGAYYYIINLSSNCSVLSGSLSIIR